MFESFSEFAKRLIGTNKSSPAEVEALVNSYQDIIDPAAEKLLNAILNSELSKDQVSSYLKKLFCHAKSHMLDGMNIPLMFRNYEYLPLNGLMKSVCALRDLYLANSDINSSFSENLEDLELLYSIKRMETKQAFGDFDCVGASFKLEPDKIFHLAEQLVKLGAKFGSGLYHADALNFRAGIITSDGMHADPQVAYSMAIKDLKIAYEILSLPQHDGNSMLEHVTSKLQVCYYKLNRTDDAIDLILQNLDRQRNDYVSEDKPNSDRSDRYASSLFLLVTNLLEKERYTESEKYSQELFKLAQESQDTRNQLDVYLLGIHSLYGMGDIRKADLAAKHFLEVSQEVVSEEQHAKDKQFLQGLRCRFVQNE